LGENVGVCGDEVQKLIFYKGDGLQKAEGLLSHCSREGGQKLKNRGKREKPGKGREIGLN